MYQAERGLFELRKGRPLYITQSASGGALVASVDGLMPGVLEELRLFGAVRLVITSHRSESLGIGSDDTSPGFSLSLNGEGPEQIVQLASAHKAIGSDDHDVRPASITELAGMTLVRLAQMLPAVVSVDVGGSESDILHGRVVKGTTLAVSASEVSAWATDGSVEVTYVSEGPVPLALADDARFMTFRESTGLREHVAVLIGQQDHWPDPLPVRIHSACLTGDLFGSLRCDCGDQLRGSLRLFAEQGGGVLLYMSQEGRDIGLANKLRAYALQGEGLDTVDADQVLGFGSDERVYGAAVQMLKTLNITRVELLTNNPNKIDAVRSAGIEVVHRRPLYGTLNRHNRAYVKAKIERSGHWLSEMLADALSEK
jgi:GTP cyclohydrolase II